MARFTSRAPADEGGHRPGAIFPDYELSDHRRTHRTLSELEGGDP
jgi:hypothetical protein